MFRDRKSTCTYIIKIEKNLTSATLEVQPITGYPILIVSICMGNPILNVWETPSLLSLINMYEKRHPYLSICLGNYISVPKQFMQCILTSDDFELINHVFCRLSRRLGNLQDQMLQVWNKHQTYLWRGWRWMLGKIPLKFFLSIPLAYSIPFVLVSR